MILDYFPGKPRPEQELVLNKIEDSFKNGKKFIIVQAPTGSGKSHVGATLASSTGVCPSPSSILSGTPKTYNGLSPMKYGAFVLTTTKQLQHQYDKLFEGSTILKGRDNYPCMLDEQSDVTTAPCMYRSDQMQKCSNAGECIYLEDYKAAMCNNFSVLNYNMYFSLPEPLQHKDILICDEASEFEDQVISFYTLQLTYKLLNKLNISYSILKRDNTEDCYLWLCDILEELKRKMPSVNKSMSNAQVKKYRAFKTLKEKVTLLVNNWHTSEFCVELIDGGVDMSPLKANKLARILLKNVDRVVFMSATIIDHEAMAKSIGINSAEYDFIDVPSSFDAKKSPIYISPAKYDMRYAKIDSELPKLVNDVLDLCEVHKDWNGIIHTNSFKITEAFRKAVGKDPRFLIRDKDVTNEMLLMEHYERKDPTVLISPSLAFGTSLDDEHGRFQIVAKLPYLPMSSKRVKEASKNDFSWYQMKMWVKLVQMCGRCTRSKEDHSITYIFDKSFIGAIGRYKNKLPKWFVDRLV